MVYLLCSVPVSTCDPENSMCFEYSVQHLQGSKSCVKRSAGHMIPAEYYTGSEARCNNYQYCRLVGYNGHGDGYRYRETKKDPEEKIAAEWVHYSMHPNNSKRFLVHPKSYLYQLHSVDMSGALLDIPEGHNLDLL